MKYLKHFLSEHKGKVAQNVFLALAQSVGILLLPMLMAGIVDQGILAGNMGGRLLDRRWNASGHSIFYNRGDLV